MLDDIALVSAAVRVLDRVHAKRDVRPAVDDARLDEGLMEVVVTHEWEHTGTPRVTIPAADGPMADPGPLSHSIRPSGFR